MIDRFRLTAAIFILILFATISSLHAHWVEDGIAVCTDAASQSTHAIAPDGSGGAFIAWIDNRNGNPDLYAQRINVSGSALWTANGLPFCTDVSNIASLRITSDISGGAIMTWLDYRNGNTDIYAQRTNSIGAPRWTLDGTYICNEASDQSNHQLVYDGSGGAIIVWDDWRNGNMDIFAQRIDAGGLKWWLNNGLAVCTAANNQTGPQIATDGAGGAIITWSDIRNGNYDIFAQRVEADGTPKWTADGVAICTAIQPQGNPQILSDGAGGAIIVWQDWRSGNYDIFAQRINSSGVVQWTPDGVGICTIATDQASPFIASDGAGGAIVTWLDSRSGYYEIYARKIDATGTPQWTTNGVLISSMPIFLYDAKIISDDQGGAIITWHDYTNVYAQHVDNAGNALWQANGILVSGATGNQSLPVLVPNDAGGAILAWMDTRNANNDIYGGSIEFSGQIYEPAPDIASVDDISADQGGLVYLSWNASRDEALHGDWVSHYTVWRAIDPVAALLMLEGGAVVLAGPEDIRPGTPRDAIRIEQLSCMLYYWQLIETLNLYYQDTYGLPVSTLHDSTSAGTGYHYFQVVAHTNDPMVFWASDPDSGYSVDNLAPCTPLALAGEQSFVPEGLALTWALNSENDLDHYRVYRGASEGFVPGPGNILGSPCDTTMFDAGWTWSSGYWYKVSAVDVHGNESGYALLGPDGVTGDDVPAVPHATYLDQNHPNPFNPVTIITFGLAEPAHVSLRIYDVAGRLVRVLVDEHRIEDRYEVTWDGRDGTGSQVASGVYFYNLHAGTFNETVKMVLLR